MANEPEDDAVDALLSPKKLSRAEHDRIFEAAFDAVSREDAPVPWWKAAWRRYGLSIALGAATATAVLLFVPINRPPPAPDGFQVKGGAGAPLIVEALCTPPPGACRPGRKLLMALTNVHAAGFVGAFGVSPSGRTVWYFSGDESPQVPRSDQRIVLGQGVVLGADNAEPGTWKLHVVLSPKPLTPQTLAGAEVTARAQTTFEVER